MDALKVIALIMGGLLLYNGYVEKGPSPTPDNPSPVVVPDDQSVTIKIISDANEPIPALPGNPAVASASAPIRQILSVDPNDAVKFARSTAGFAELIGRSSAIKTTGEFQSALMEAFEILYQRRGFQKYALNAPIQATLIAAFSSVPGAVSGGNLAPIDWTPATQAAALEALNALSYQGYQAFIDGHKKAMEVPSYGM